MEAPTQPFEVPPDLHQRAEFFHVALSLLLSRQQNSLLPEALYFLSPDQVVTMCATFGGNTIRVPTTKELGADLLAAAAIYYHEHLGWTWPRIQDKLQLPDGRMRQLVKQFEDWTEFMKGEPAMARGSLKLESP